MANTQAVFNISKDAGEPLDVTKELTVADIIRYTVPSGGPFVTGAPQSNTLTEGSDILLSPLATIAADTLSNPMTIADVLLFKEVSEAGSGGVTTNATSLTAGFVYMPVEDPTSNIFEMNGQTLTGGVANYPTLAAKWPAWVSGADIVLPDWRGRAMMAMGALGITGAAGATYSDATARNGLRIVYTNNGGTVDFAGGSSQFNNGGGTWQNSNIPQNNFGALTGDTETRPNAVGLVLCVIAGDLVVGQQAIDHFSRTNGDGSAGTTDTYTVWGDAGKTVSLGTFDVPIPAFPGPTSMVIQTVVGNQTGNGLTANGVYRSNNSGALQNVGFGNWTWRIKVTTIGNWIQQHYWNDTGNIAYRESFNGGATWTAWGN